MLLVYDETPLHTWFEVSSQPRHQLSHGDAWWCFMWMSAGIEFQTFVGGAIELLTS